MRVVVDYPASDYVQHALQRAIQAALPAEQILLGSAVEAKSIGHVDLQFSDYDQMDWDLISEHPKSSMANSYVIRKSLIRKHYLANTIAHYVAKHPQSMLKKATLPTFSFELSYPDDLDELFMDDLYDVAQSMPDKWFILKPGMADKAQGIRLFHTAEQLEAIFQEFEDASSSDDDDSGSGDDDAEKYITVRESTTARENTAVSLGQMRHWVVQEYLSNPLLIKLRDGFGSQKFHLRVYVLAIQGIRVYLYDHILALFAAEPYMPPTDDDIEDLSRHLTNTCLQEEMHAVANPNVCLIRDLVGSDTSNNAPLETKHVEHVVEQLTVIVGELFKAAVQSGSQFQPLPNAFEIFGLDFLVDEQFNAHLLEVNSCPDFAQTGDQLNTVIEHLFQGTLELAVRPFFNMEPLPDSTSMTHLFRPCLDQQIMSW